MEIQIAVAKATKFGSQESGDTLEVVERPNGGLSVVLCDGQASGRQAKMLSSLVVHKVISLLAEGVRDGAAARAASDFLYTERNGQASVYLSILSADLQTNTLVLTRNNPTPTFIAHRDQVEMISGVDQPIGVARNIRPAITEIPLEAGITVVMYTDGLGNAGSQYGGGLDICTALEAMLEDREPEAQELADSLLLQAIRLDQGRPNDDMSVVVLRVLSRETDMVRRLIVRLPLASPFYGGGTGFVASMGDDRELFETEDDERD